MAKLIYEAPREVSRDEAQSIFDSGDTSAICKSLVGLAFYEPDWKWVQDQCVEFSTHPNADVRRVSVLCLSHLARIHRALDLEEVSSTLQRLKNDPEVAGSVEDAIEDIELSMNVDLF
jgi:hypothetical protein